jgi:integrase
MSTDHSTPATPPAKPAKPYPDFPLFPHATKRWAKKIRGQLHYFGPWSDPDGALARYLDQKDALNAGRKPRPEAGEGLTVKQLCNDFLNAKLALADVGEITRRTWRELKLVCDLVVGHFGKGRLVTDLDPADFAGLRDWMTRKWGPTVVAVTIGRIRSVFKFAGDNKLIPARVCYGSGFKPPSRKVLRLRRAERGPQLFSPAEVHKILAAAPAHLRAMVLLSINAGLGNTDLGKLPLAALDLESGWLDYPRPKTGLPRRCPLWPETVEALRAALAKRPEPNDPAHAGLVFVTRLGGPWAGGKNEHCLAKVFGMLLRQAGVEGRGRGLYALRHTFRTVADGARDQPAADLMMGHEVSHMSSIYREAIEDARLRAVADHVRTWLFGPPAGPAGAGPDA